MIEQGNRADIRIDRASGPRHFLTNRVRLISPEDGEVTLPLQKFPWPEENPGTLATLADNRYTAAKWQQFLLENDRSLPRGVLFAWESLNGAEYPLSYDLEIAQDPYFNQKVIAVRGLTQARTRVYNLRIGTPYYWKVTARANLATATQAAPQPAVVAESHVAHFTTNPMPPRWIFVPGITNVRDIGGWPLPDGRRVRQEMVYRGSEMNSHCAITAEGQRVLVDELGIRTDVDLRGMGEECAPVLDPKKVEYVNIPVLAYDSIVSPEHIRYYRALFGLFATRSIYPIFTHCWGGADRTGTIIFLLLALLGVGIEDLSTEYELTSLSVWGERLRDSEAFQDLLQTLELFAARGSSIQTQVERYMNVIGVTEEEVERIREILTE